MGTVRTGALLTSFTVTAKEFVALSGGWPLSVTTVVIVLVPGPCASDGVQVITPLVSIAAPAGGLIIWYVSCKAGMSESPAVFVTISRVSSSMVRSFCAGNDGHWNGLNKDDETVRGAQVLRIHRRSIEIRDHSRDQIRAWHL